jgi:hypothetical protein
MKRRAWSARFLSTSRRTGSARTRRQIRAAQIDRIALSSPHRATIPPTITFESRKRRGRAERLTSSAGCWRNAWICRLP